MAEGKLLANYATVLELLLRLRQACDHPYLSQSRGGLGASRGALARKLGEAGPSAHAAAVLSKAWPAEGAVPSGARPSGAGAGGAGAEEASDFAGDANPSGAVPPPSADECPICLDPMEDAVMTSCLHTFCRECILHVIGEARRAACPLCRAVVGRADLTTLPRASRFNVDLDDPATCHSSAKIDALISELRAGFAQEETDRSAAGQPESETAARRPLKAVIFSQWNGMLDLVEAAIRRELGVRTVRLDGSLSLDRRRAVLAAFRQDDSVKLMLLSLRAGNVGLNLTAAQRVYLLDPW